MEISYENLSRSLYHYNKKNPKPCSDTLEKLEEHLICEKEFRSRSIE